MQNPVPGREIHSTRSLLLFDRINLTKTSSIFILILATTIAFLPALQNDFVNWDDWQNLIQNDAYRGFSANHLYWMFTTTQGGHYQPLSWLSFAMDHYLWGLDPTGFHGTNIILHILTAIIFFYITRILMCKIMSNEQSGIIILGALFAALLFSIHPLRVESVAWATERRDVLSGFWLMLAIAGYLHAQNRHSSSIYILFLTLSLFAYILSLLSKAAGITLPVVLLLLDRYPLKRFSIHHIHSTQDSFKRIILEKIIYCIPAISVASLALWAQSKSGALWSIQEHPISLRVSQAFYGIMFYPIKTLWPAGLIPLYEQRPDASALEIVNILAAMGVITLTVLFWKLRRRVPSLLCCWFIYLVLLSPMLGFAQSGSQVVADRYSYLSCMPWAILLGCGLIKLYKNYASNTTIIRATSCISVAVVILFIFLTQNQTRIWSDSYTLWTTTIERAPNTPTAHANLAVVLNQRKEFERAIKHSRVALSTLPNKRVAHIALARASAAMNDLDTAAEHFQIALDINKNLGRSSPNVMIKLIYIQTKRGRFDEADQLYVQIRQLDQTRDMPLVTLSIEAMAAGHAERGDFNKAVHLLEEELNNTSRDMTPSTRARIETLMLLYRSGKTLLDQNE